MKIKIVNTLKYLNTLCYLWCSKYNSIFSEMTAYKGHNWLFNSINTHWQPTRSKFKLLFTAPADFETEKLRVTITVSHRRKKIKHRNVYLFWEEISGHTGENSFTFHKGHDHLIFPSRTNSCKAFPPHSERKLSRREQSREVLKSLLIFYLVVKIFKCRLNLLTSGLQDLQK